MKRSSNGESTIYEDKNGRWHGEVWMGLKEGGAPDRRHVSGKTRAVVAAKVRELQNKRDAGQTAQSGRVPTVGEWLDYWLTHIAARRLRPRTLESYQTTVRLHIRPGIGHYRLDRLQPEHLEKFYVAIENKGLSASTALRAHRIVSRALKVAMQRGRVSRNVATLVDAPAAKRPVTPLPLDVEECRRVLAAARESRNAARWTVALALGLRQSEALGLMWTDIDFTRGTLAVRRGLHRVTGQGLTYEEPKTERSRRVIVVPKKLLAELRAHKKAQDREREESADYWTEHGLVFPNELGGPMDDRNDYRAWVRLLRTAKVRRIRLHDGRHTAATLLLAEGIHPRVVMELLGHSTMRTTTDTYSHVMPALAQQAADTLDAALWSDPKGGKKAKKNGKGKKKPKTATKTATKDDQGP
ncbi:MAG: Integrase [Frankiales bacterium]|nr:Integrase [Frankiales bacterium]